MDFLPVFLNIKNKACLVVGGGEVATRKIMLLLQTGAHVSVVSPELSSTLNEFYAQGKIKHHAEFFQSGHLEDILKLESSL